MVLVLCRWFFYRLAVVRQTYIGLLGFLEPTFFVHLGDELKSCKLDSGLNQLDCGT